MKISVIIPCHNAGPWIAEALESVAGQTYQPHEVIVVDDASTDDSVERVQKSDVDVRLLHTRLGNAAAVRNHGARWAKAEWLAFLDSDDVWYSDHLAVAARLLGAGTDCAFLSHHDAIDEVSGAKYSRPAVAIEDGSTGLSDREFYRVFTGPNCGSSRIRSAAALWSM